MTIRGGVGDYKRGGWVTVRGGVGDYKRGGG